MLHLSNTVPQNDDFWELCMHYHTKGPKKPEISGQTEIIYLQGGYTQNKILKWSHTRLSCVL